MPQIPLTEGYRIAPVNPGSAEQFHQIRPNTQEVENWGAVGKGMTGGLSVTVGKAVEDAIDDADRTQALALANDLRRRTAQLTYGDDGYVKKRGRNALAEDLSANYGNKLQKEIDALSKQANPRARKYFSQYANRISQGMHDSIDRHVYKESLAVEASEIEEEHALISQNIQMAVQNRDIEGVHDGLEDMRAMTDRVAAKNGLKPDYTKTLGPQVLGVLSTMMSNDTDWKMVSAFANGARARGYFDAKTNATVTKQVDAYRKDKISDALAADIFAKNKDNEAAALKEFEKRKPFEDEDDNRAALTKLQVMFTGQDQIRKAAEKQATDAYDAWYLKNSGPNNLHPDPRRFPGFNALPVHTRAALVREHNNWLHSEQEKRLRGARAGGRASAADGFPEGTDIPVYDDAGNQKETVKLTRDMLIDAAAYMAESQISNPEEFQSINFMTDKTKGIPGVPDGIPLAYLFSRKQRNKLTESQSKKQTAEARRVRTEALQILQNEYGLSRKEAGIVSVTLGDMAMEEVAKQGKQRVAGNPNFKADLFSTNQKVREFIRGKMQEVDVADTFLGMSSVMGHQFSTSKPYAKVVAEQRAKQAADPNYDGSGTRIVGVSKDARNDASVDRAYKQAVWDGKKLKPRNVLAPITQAVQQWQKKNPNATQLPALTPPQRSYLAARQMGGFFAIPEAMRVSAEAALRKRWIAEHAEQGRKVLEGKGNVVFSPEAIEEEIVKQLWLGKNHAQKKKE